MAEFDDIAHKYDADFTQSEIGKMQRDLVWEFFLKHSPSSKQSISLLEMNCGTGEDALFFAKQGIFVCATDISTEMLSVVEKKIQKEGLAARICSQKWDLTQGFSPEKSVFPPPYSIAFSNFGGWNCLKIQNIETLAENLSDILLQNGKLFVVIMPRFCIWESFYFLYKRKWKEIFRRLKRKAVPAKLDNVFVDTYYYSPSDIGKFLSSHFKIIDYQAVGIFLPPSYLEKFFIKMPKFLSLLNKIEKYLPKFRFWAFASDHFVMVLEKENKEK